MAQAALQEMADFPTLHLTDLPPPQVKIFNTITLQGCRKELIRSSEDKGFMGMGGPWRYLDGLASLWRLSGYQAVRSIQAYSLGTSLM